MKQLQSDTFIYIDERQTSRYKTIPYQIRFELNRSNLQTILKAKKNNLSLQFSSETLTDLRYYALFSYKHKIPLVFITNYRNKEIVSVVKTSIFLEGKFFNQIQRDIINHPQILHHLIQSHHWLVFQALTQIRSKRSNFRKYVLLAFILLIIFVGLVLIWLF